MKEFIENLTGRLEEEKDNVIVKDTYTKGKNAGLRKAEVIVNQLAEEYNKEHDDTDYANIELYAFWQKYQWIPCSERLPEDCTIYEVTAQFGNGMCYTEFAYYDESKGEWWKHDDDGLVNVLAWKEHSAPYQPKGE